MMAVSERNPWLYPRSCDGFELFAGQSALSETDKQYAWTVSETLLQTLQSFAITEELVNTFGDQSVQAIVDQIVAGKVSHEHAATLKQLIDQHPRGEAIVAFARVLVECWMGATAISLQLEDFEEIDLIGDDPGGHCLVTHGMEQTVKHLASSIATGVIRKKVPVTLLEYSAQDGVTVHVQDGRSIHADHVIVTCSLGALKSEKIKFSPPLPPAKWEAIQRSSMGQYMKIVVEFPRVFWPSNARFFGQTEVRTDARLSFPLVTNYFKIKGAPMLEAVLFGDAALEASDLDNSVIVDAFVDHLHQLFGGDIVLSPVNHFITRWDKDPWAVGTYSFLTLDSSTEDPERLRETVADRVLFAGEATNVQYQGSLQAAYLSGLAAVDELDKLWGRASGPTLDQ